jgi:hypothetical protein
MEQTTVVAQVPHLPQAVFPWYTLVHAPEGADEITTYPGRWPRQTATKTTHSAAGSGPGEGRNASTRRILYISAGSRPSRWHGWATGEQFTTTTTPPRSPSWRTRAVQFLRPAGPNPLGLSTPRPGVTVAVCVTGIAMD